MSGIPRRDDEPVYELAEGGSTLRVYPHIEATTDDFLTIEINGPADSVRLCWIDALDLSDAIRDAAGQGTFKEDALREAEKRGAVKALREAAQDWVANADPTDPDDLDALVARKLDERAAIIESGRVTL